jgi:hypothetical protein
MAKLTLFPNEPNHEPGKQFKEIQTAFLGINSWANRLNNELDSISTGSGTQGPIGNTGPAGAQGAPGVISGTFPILYNSGTQTVSIDPSGVAALMPTIVYAEIPTGDVDGVNTQYRTAGQIIGNCLLFKNGLAQTPSIDYTSSVSTITMTTPPPINSKMLVNYQYTGLTVPLAWDANVVAAYFLKTDSLDSTTYGRDLNNYGAAETFTSIDGRDCPTIFYSRGGGYVSPIITQLSGLSSFTLECEMYHHSNDTREFAVTDSLNFYSAQMASNTTSYFNHNNVEFPLVTIPTTGVWYQMAMVRNGTRQKVYINNALSSDVAATWSLAGDPTISIGKDWYDGSYVDCSIRNVVISNIARTSFPTTQV